MLCLGVLSGRKSARMATLFDMTHLLVYSVLVLLAFISETIVDASNSSGTSATGTNGSAERKNTTPGELRPSKLSRPPPDPSSPHPDINKTDTSPKRGEVAGEATGTAVAVAASTRQRI